MSEPLKTIRVVAPAKLNLGLRVTGRRADGYHTLASLFVPIDLSDELEIELARDAARGARETGAPLDVALTLSGDVPGVPTGDANLAVRAARAYGEAAGLAGRARLRLLKRIPAAAGLGGGSSDAGAVLRGLDRLTGGTVDRAGLERIALGLGADVPFFLDPRPAFVTGIGEIREPVDLPAPLHLVLAHPGLPLATADVFRAFDAAHPALTAPDATPTMRALSGLPGQRAETDRRALNELLTNDLEPAAQRLCPAIVGLRDALARAGARGVGLSGSGPTMFGLFDGPEAARAAVEVMALAPPAWARQAGRWAAVDPVWHAPAGSAAGRQRG